MLNEHTRGQVLHRLGVSPWYARKKLLGALPSPFFDLAKPSQELALDEAGERLVQPAVEAAKPVDGSAIQLLAGLKEADESSLKPEAPLPTVQVSESVTNPKVELAQTEVGGQAVATPSCLRLYRVARLLILTESGVDVPSPRELALLANMLSACQVKDPALNFLGNFNWPVFSSERLPVVSGADFSSTLVRWVRQVDNCQDYLCLVMGKNTASYEGTVKDAVARTISIDESLVDMLSMPAKKAGVWRQLIPNIELISEYG